MTESIKFGPEWLRNLSGDSSNSGGGGGGTANLIVPRYQLAEHRYGREEMLALFDRNCKPPEALALLQTLYVEKTQLPLAFVPMTEDETRNWSIGVGTGAVRGRGGSVDRGGRGRPGRGGMYTSHYSRGVGFDDSGDGTRLESQSYTPRNRGFDRSQSERGWTERNGVSDTVEWNGSTSPRKEMSRGTSGSSLMEGNWRRQRGGTSGGDDDEGWRTAANRNSIGGIGSSSSSSGGGGGGSSNTNDKWIRGSWRDGNVNDRDRLDRSDGGGGDNIDDNRPPPGRWDPRPTHRQSHDSVTHHHSVPSRTSRTWDSNHHDNHDNLPEWATENPSESGGSFDASGAFHGGTMFSDDDDDAGGKGNNHNISQEMRIRRVSEGNNGTHKGGKIIYQSPVGNRHQNIGIINSITKERPKSLHPFDDKDTSITTPPPTTTTTTDRSSISPTKQTTNNLTKDSRRIQNSNDPVTPKVIQGPQRSKSFIDPPTKTLPQQNNIIRNKQIDQTTPVPVSSPSSLVTSSASITTSTPSSSNHKAQLLQSKNLQNIADIKESMNQVDQKPDDDDERMKEEANMLVAKLMADEENHKEEERLIHVVPPVVSQVPPPQPPPPSSIVNPVVQEKWFYQDPQGEVQGPFLPNEMAEWCKAGYFTPGLLIRRTCDERFLTLGDLMKMCGRVPFTPGPPIPPFKITEPIISPIPNTGTAGIPSSALPKPPQQQQPQIDDPLLLLQYSQLRVLHDQMLFQQAKNAATAKLSRLEQWNNLNQVEKNHLVTQCIMQDPEIREITMNASQFAPQLTPQTTNPVMQLFSQLQSGKLQSDNNHLAQNSSVHPAAAAATGVHPSNVIGPVQHLMDQMRGIPTIPVPSQPTVVPQPQQLPPQSSQNEDPIKSLLRQLHGGVGDANGHPPQQIDSIWPQPPPQINPQFNAQNWLAQVGPMPPVPPGQMPNYLWDLPKEMKTEQQILEEQNLRLQEDRTKEELRKQEELLRKAKDESLKRKTEEEQKHARQLEESKRKEEQKKLKEEERLRKEEEKRRIEEELRRKEEKIRKENEERKREEKRKIDEENNRKKQEEEKKRRDELKRQEEKQKKEDEKRRKLEEEQRKIEDERLKKEEEARKKLEQEENARKAEQRRREADALKKLQERSKAPWAPQATSVPTQSAASLAEIQKLEREMKAEELRYQQLMQQQLNQQKALQAAKEAAAIDSSKRLQFKWAEKAASNLKQPQVKSLDQIQQEEQERIAKSKQQEKEKAEKSNVKENAAVMQSAGIWGTASQSLNWTTTTSSSLSSTTIPSNTFDNTKSTAAAATVPSKSPWAGTGFWDEPVANKINTPVKQTPVKTTISSAAKPSTANPTLQNQNSQNNNNNNINNNNKAAKAKAGKKEEEIVKKMFDNNSGKDEFGQWCYRTLCGLQSTVDIPTFVGFLKEIESAYEVKEYVKMYLGESKQTTEFVKQFLEKRSKLRSAQRPQAEADDLCKPAPAVNPNAPTEFQEVKGKSKKPKKGKMFKVDNTILGFSVTAATDRINVGDRDYGEGV